MPYVRALSVPITLIPADPMGLNSIYISFSQE